MGYRQSYDGLSTVLRCDIKGVCWGTGRKFGVRKAEQETRSRNSPKGPFHQVIEEGGGDNKSAINDHVAQGKKSKILSKGSNKFTRWIREAVHIQRGNNVQ